MRLGDSAPQPPVFVAGPTSEESLTEAPFARFQEAVQGGDRRHNPCDVLALTTARTLPREGRFMGRNPWKTAHRRLVKSSYTGAAGSIQSSFRLCPVLVFPGTNDTYAPTARARVCGGSRAQDKPPDFPPEPPLLFSGRCTTSKYAKTG